MKNIADWVGKSIGVAAVTASLCLLATAHAAAEVQLPPLLGDHCVVQQDVPIPVWGTAAPGEQVTVTLGPRKASTQADASGKWRLNLEALPAGGPFALIANQVTVQDVMVGEVWLASGQSNMELPVGRTANAQQEVAQSAQPLLRMFTVKHIATIEPLTEAEGKWEVASPETTREFSAAAYFFARRLCAELKVPVGIINSSWGATGIEAWINRDDLATDPSTAARIENSMEKLRQLPAQQQKYRANLAAWEEKYAARDTGNKGFVQGWADPNADLSAWKKIQLPSTGAKLGLSRGGAIWLRKDIDIADPAAAATWTFDLGPLGEYDTAYFNGVEFGTSGNDALDASLPWRVYDLPSKLVRKGRNTLAIRVFFHHPVRAILSRGQEMDLFGDAGHHLVGEWYMRVESELPELDDAAGASLPVAPRLPAQYEPTVLFHSMIAPLRPFSFRGTIWYQGEQDAGHGREYRKQLPMLIESWRKYWGRDAFPFYIVQLPNFKDLPVYPSEPSDSHWAELREAQFLASKAVPNTGLAVTIDIGDPLTVHPRNKQDVGGRLALLALGETYGRPGEWSGPAYDAMTVEKGAIRIRFTHTAVGLVARGGPLKSFAIAGPDRKFVWAEAKIEGNTVVVRSAQVTDPVAVRYAWADDPESCNLYNVDGLPATPFRTDDWPRQQQ